MKRTLSHTASIIGLALGLTASTAFSQTTANGPYYATPSWDQTLPASTRFIVLSNLNSQAVLDRETGLVWERSPMTSEAIWVIAMERCTSRTVGQRQGWRLPNIQELRSLIDPTSSPALPVGHPFVIVDSGEYWSATTNQATTVPDSAYAVRFNEPNVNFISGKSNFNLVWCVRGGTGPEKQ